MKYSRDFKGVWIPREIWLNEQLSLVQKAMLVEIDSLSVNGKPCFASNQHFADFLGISRATVKRALHELEEKGLVNIRIEYDGKQVKARHIRMSLGSKCSDPKVKMSRGVGSKCTEGWGQNEPVSNNNKSKNNKSNTESNVERQTAPSGKPEQIAEIIGYLNKRVGTHYRATTRKTQTLIKARLNEGFTVDDFKQVIDNKAEAWLGDQKMEKYLRPETLFGTKFEGYLNERSTPQVGGDGIVVGTDYAKLAKEQDEAYQESLENMGEVHDKELPW